VNIDHIKEQSLQMNESCCNSICSNRYKTNNKFLLSIVIPTFNRQHELSLLLEQLKTELDGKQDEVEVIVSDNNSSDQTKNVLKEYVTNQTDNLAIKCFVQPLNMGAIMNLHFLISQSRGKYTWALGDDDALVPGKVCEILKLLLSNPIDLLLVRAEGIGEWNQIPRVSLKNSNVQLRKVRLQDEYSADYLFAGGFLGSVIINTKTWKNLLPKVEELYETQYSNWAAVLNVATDCDGYYVFDEICVKGNFNMQGSSAIPVFHVLVMGRVKVWSTFAGAPLESVLRDRVKELACMGWGLIACGKINDIVTLTDKLNALRLTVSLLGLHGLKSYLFALVSILFPFPKVLEKIRVALKDH